MSDSRKRLLKIGVPIALCTLLVFFLSGNRLKNPVKFANVDEIITAGTQVGTRYEIAGSSKPNLDLPPLNLDFLENTLAQEELPAEAAELPGNVAVEETDSVSADANQLPEAASDSSAVEAEIAIPLSPPVSQQPAVDSQPVASERNQETDSVKNVTFDDEEGSNDFPLIPPSAAIPATNKTFGIPEFKLPPEKVADAAGSTATNETQLAEKKNVDAGIPMPAEIPQVASVPAEQQVVARSVLPSAPQNRADNTLPEQPAEASDSHSEVAADSMASSDSETPPMMSLPPSILTQIRQRLDYGTSLARRGAFASAEDVYLQVIRLIAETKDTQIGGREFTMRLANGLTAMEEAEDFITSDLKTRVRINVATIIQGHNTTVLQDEDANGMTSIQALQRYYEYAGEMIAGACGQEAVGSETLYFLGKLYASNSQNDPSSSAMRNARSMTMYQASLEASPMNYRAANELGVLLAQYGRFDDAKEMLIHAVSTYPEPIAWKNLAFVHERLGETKLAELADKESKIAAEELAQRKTSAAGGPIQWVEPETFVRTGGNAQEFVDSASEQPVEQQPVDVKEQRKSDRTAKAPADWWKVWKR